MDEARLLLNYGFPNFAVVNVFAQSNLDLGLNALVSDLLLSSIINFYLLFLSPRRVYLIRLAELNVPIFAYFER